MRAAAQACVASPKTNTRLPVRYVESTEREYHGRRECDARSSAGASSTPASAADLAQEVARRADADRHGAHDRLPEGPLRASAPRVPAISGVEHDVEVGARGCGAMSATVAPSGATTCTSTPTSSSSRASSRTSSRQRNPSAVAPSRLQRGRRPARRARRGARRRRERPAERAHELVERLRSRPSSPSAGRRAARAAPPASAGRARRERRPARPGSAPPCTTRRRASRRGAKRSYASRTARLNSSGGVAAEVARLERRVRDRRAAVAALDHREQQVGVRVALRCVQHVVHAAHRRRDAHRADVRRPFVGPELSFIGRRGVRRRAGRAGRAGARTARRDRRPARSRGSARTRARSTTSSHALGLERIREAEPAHHEVGARGAAPIELALHVLSLARQRRPRAAARARRRRVVRSRCGVPTSTSSAPQLLVRGSGRAGARAASRGRRRRAVRRGAPGARERRRGRGQRRRDGDASTTARRPRRTRRPPRSSHAVVPLGAERVGGVEVRVRRARSSARSVSPRNGWASSTRVFGADGRQGARPARREEVHRADAHRIEQPRGTGPRPHRRACRRRAATAARRSRLAPASRPRAREAGVLALRERRLDAAARVVAARARAARCARVEPLRRRARGRA